MTLINEDICIYERELQGVDEKLCFFPRNFIILPPLPRKHWAAIGCTETGQPIGVT